MNVFWVAICLVVAVVAASVVRPTRLQKNAHTLLEIGVAISAMLLVSPLTEYIYMTALILPLLAIYIFVRQSGDPSPPVRLLLGGIVVVWLILCLPIQHFEFFLWSKMNTASAVASLYVVLSPAFLYVSIGLLGLELIALRSLLRQSAPTTVQRLVPAALGG
jgi:hypothetical protein